MSENLGAIKWKKPNGNEIETNDRPATVKYCESLGWEKGKHTKAKQEKKAD